MQNNTNLQKNKKKYLVNLLYVIYKPQKKYRCDENGLNVNLVECKISETNIGQSLNLFASKSKTFLDKTLTDKNWINNKNIKQKQSELIIFSTVVFSVFGGIQKDIFMNC